MLLTFAILLITVALFISGRYRADSVAMLALLALLLFGLVDTREALAGFAAAPVIMIAALFLVGGGLTATGVTHWLGQRLVALAGTSETRLLLCVMIGTAVLSGFMSNTGVVAMLLPAVITACHSIGTPAARVLIPMAYAANLGGLLTLIGTPPNIIVNEELLQQDLGPFGFFSFALIGAPLLLITTLYMTFIGRKQLHTSSGPTTNDKRADGLAHLLESYGLEGQFFELIVEQDSQLIGHTGEQLLLSRNFGIVVLTHRRVDDPRPLEDDVFEYEALPIESQDRLLVKADPAAIAKLAAHYEFQHRPVTIKHVLAQRALLSKKLGLAEGVIPPRSRFIDKIITPGRLDREEKMQALAMRRRGSIMVQNAGANGTVQLREGDAILMRASWSTIRRMQRRQHFIMLGDPKRLATEHRHLDRHSYIAVAILAGMVLLMLSGLLPAVTCTLLAAAAMVLTGCLTMDEGYHEINWQSVVLIAAMVPMATAIENTGGAQWLAEGVMTLTREHSPVFLLSGIFILTSLLSQVISNTASTILLVPIVMATAQGMDLSPYPLLMGLAVAASCSLLTPIGTVPNLLVMVPGNYQFSDYFKCGFPLTLLLFCATILLVPRIWPF
jgi:di/tricarboxylate transporter